MIDTIHRELRTAARSLVRTPATSAAAILTPGARDRRHHRALFGGRRGAVEAASRCRGSSRGGGHRQVGRVEERLAQPATPEVTLAWGLAARTQNLVVRSTIPPTELVAALRREIAAAAPAATVWDVRTGDTLVQRSLGRQRFAGLLVAIFGALALVLGAIGIYGVVAHLTRRRRREIGLRIALGARPTAVVRLVVGSGMLPVALGSLAGCAAVLAGGRWLAGLLYEVSPADPATVTAAVGVLAVVALGACALPAARALRIDSAIALREE